MSKSLIPNFGKDENNCCCGEPELTPLYILFLLILDTRSRPCGAALSFLAPLLTAPTWYRRTAKQVRLKVYLRWNPRVPVPLGACLCRRLPTSRSLSKRARTHPARLVCLDLCPRASRTCKRG